MRIEVENENEDEDRMEVQDGTTERFLEKSRQGTWKRGEETSGMVTASARQGWCTWWN
ncbi:hypothetical protein EMPG_11139, partial [Blastomyces silverae]